MWKCLAEFLPGKTKSSPKGLIKDQVIETNKTKITNMFIGFVTNIGVEHTNKILHYTISDHHFPVNSHVPKLNLVLC